MIAKIKHYIYRLTRPIMKPYFRYTAWATTNFGFRKIKKHSKTDGKFSVLDVGAGNHSATRFKASFDCDYYGLDISKNYNNDANDFALMKDFYEIDLTSLNFASIPDNYFDVIHFSHVIEHLYNGDKVLEALLPKLKSGGIFYIEYPAIRSIYLPSKPGTLNFYDDGSHIRLYALYELLNVFTTNNFQILDKGVRRARRHIIAMPIMALRHKLLRGGPLMGGFFWDLYKFADYIVAKKK